jgi:uncharacterized cysteine cluster protein YcgN (CxxCxxCC family)
MNMKFALAAVVVAALSACGQTKTQEYYLSHPDELAADQVECKQLGNNTFNCNEAAKAAVILKKKN